MSSKFMIYGATGYTGKLSARMAAENGLSPVLAGRSDAKLRAVAEPLGFAHRCVSLEDSVSLDAALEDVSVVLHTAGPFSATSRPMSEACLRTGTHYLDITGEIAVFETLHEASDQAREKGIMLMPGVGFDVVPSDCIAAHLARRLQDPTHLTLSVKGLDSPSRGTARTYIESIVSNIRVRQDGNIVSLSTPPMRLTDFGQGPVECMGIGWGDVSTAFYTTGIPNIEVYFKTTRELKAWARISRRMGWLLKSAPLQRFMNKQITKQPEGPGDEQRLQGTCTIVGEVRNAKGTRVATRLVTPEGYTLTGMTALAITKKVIDGHFKPGFQTPAGLYGPDLICEFQGCVRSDLEN